MTNKRGFTLIDLLFVVAIICFLIVLFALVFFKDASASQSNYGEQCIGGYVYRNGSQAVTFGMGAKC